MSDMADEAIERANELIDACGEILAGRGPMVQGVVLADLLATWLAGHVVVEEIGAEERPQTDKLREDLLAEHIEAVRRLVPENEKDILARTSAAGSA